MNVRVKTSCPLPKLRYRFTCFVSRGDLDDPAPYSDGEDLASDAHITNGRGADTERRNSPHALISAEDGAFERAAKPSAGAELAVAVRPDPEEEARKAAEKERERLQRLVDDGYCPRDGDDPQIYSRIVGVPPRTFLTRAPGYSPKSPPPTYFTDAEMMMCTKKNKEEILKGFEIPPEGGLLCVDPEVIKRQSGVFADAIKQLITTFSIERISMPVRIFEPVSMCERIAGLWRCAPYYLTNAANSRDKIDRFKQVIAFAISGIYCASQQLKPFSAILGETFQGHFDDGTQVYVEHVCHHPPIAEYYIVGPNSSYTMHAYHQFRINMSANTLVGQQDGPNTVEFPNGQKITFRYAKFKVHGVIFGKRRVYPSGVITFEDVQNRLRAAIVFNHGKKRGFFGSRKAGTKIDDMEGILYYAKKGSTQPKITQIKELTDVELPVGQISGSWLKSLNISGTIYWDIDKVVPWVLRYEENPLPSDWRFREDIIWLRRNNMPFSQEWKLRLEAEQRQDEKLRQKKA